MVKTYGESAVKVIIRRGKKKRKKYKSAENKRGRGEQVWLIKFHNLKYNAHDKNNKMILAFGCIDMCQKSSQLFFFHD